MMVIMINDNNNDESAFDVCSGEGTLTAFDLRKLKLKIQSELLDSGLQSVAIVKVCFS